MPTAVLMFAHQKRSSRLFKVESLRLCRGSSASRTTGPVSRTPPISKLCVTLLQCWFWGWDSWRCRALKALLLPCVKMSPTLRCEAKTLRFR